MTSTALAASTRRLVLADLLPGTRSRDVALVVGGAALVGVCAQIAFPLPFTPVPVTLQPFGVLLVGAALGARRGSLAMLVYLALGVAGLPWFAQQHGGPAIVHGATFGYLLGYPVVAAVVGWLAARGGDRTPLRTAATMALGSLLIYAFGVPWLMAVAHLDLAAGIAKGAAPFLLFDGIKVLAAAGLLPSTWRLVGRRGPGVNER